MLSIKLAQLLQKGMVVSVHTDTTSISSHNDLISMFELGDRNIVCYNKVSVYNSELSENYQTLFNKSNLFYFHFQHRWKF